MTVSDQQLQEWLNAKKMSTSNSRKRRTTSISRSSSSIVLRLPMKAAARYVGVSDTVPRKVVGSQVFTNLERTKAGLIEKLRLRIEAQRSHIRTAAYWPFPYPLDP